MESARGGLVGTPIRPNHRREPKWTQTKNSAVNRARKGLKPGRRQPGPLEEQLAEAPPATKVLPRGKRTFTLLRATGWKGHGPELLQSREKYNLSDVLAATAQPRDSRGLGFEGAPPTSSLLETLTGSERRSKKSVVQRVVSDGPEVFDDGLAEDDEGGLDAAAARMQLALVTQRRANDSSQRATLPIDVTNNRELFVEFADGNTEHAVMAGDGVNIFVDGNKVEVSALEEGCVPIEESAVNSLPQELRAEAERFAAIEECRVQRTSALIEGAVQEFEDKQNRALEKTRALSKEIMKDKFVSTGTTETVASSKGNSVPKRMRKVDDVARDVFPWAPDPILCKRFGVPTPEVACSKPASREDVFAPPPELKQAHVAQDDDDFGQFEISAIVNGVGTTADFKASTSDENDLFASETKFSPLPAEPQSAMSLFKAIFEAPRAAPGVSKIVPPIRETFEAARSSSGTASNVPSNTTRSRPVSKEVDSQESRASAVLPSSRKRKSRFRNAAPSNAQDKDNTTPSRRRKVLRAVDFF